MILKARNVRSAHVAFIIETTGGAAALIMLASFMAFIKIRGPYHPLHNLRAAAHRDRISHHTVAGYLNPSSQVIHGAAAGPGSDQSPNAFATLPPYSGSALRKCATIFICISLGVFFRLPAMFWTSLFRSSAGISL